MSAGLIAVTGGIGCGKSVVCRILRTRGYRVVDTDTLARTIMDSDSDIKRRLCTEINSRAVRPDGTIDRKLIASVVFADAHKLGCLNSIVHGAVRKSLSDMVADCARVLFVETAIMFQSGLNEIVDAELQIECPLETRIVRVMQRNALTREEVMARIEAQAYEPGSAVRRPPVQRVLNDGFTPVLRQIDGALAVFNNIFGNRVFAGCAKIYNFGF